MGVGRRRRDTNGDGQGREVCEPCHEVQCDALYQCLAGVVPDRCGCCQVCAQREGESTCVCREDKEVCGSDGLTYGSPCSLTEESARRELSPKLPDLSMDYWGPCKEAPIIISPPTDTRGHVGANLTLDCEARGFPAPTISWQCDNVEGVTILLPADDQDISIQMRGGPEPLMVTGWAQIVSLDPSYSGVYHCIAANSEGRVEAQVAVGVYRQEL